MNAKRIIYILALFTLSLTCLAPTYKIDPVEARLDKLKAEIIELEQLVDKNLNLYLNHLGFIESRNDPSKTNSIGAMGEWQIMPNTAKHFGLTITADEFRKNPKIFPKSLQRKILMAKIKADLMLLRAQWWRKSSSTSIDYIHTYVGKSVKGILISETGLVAACHLAGAGNVIKFLDSNGALDPDDGHKKLSDYLLEFSVYSTLSDKTVELKLKNKRWQYLTTKNQHLTLGLSKPLKARQLVCSLGIPKWISTNILLKVSFEKLLPTQLTLKMRETTQELLFQVNLKSPIFMWRKRVIYFKILNLIRAIST